MPSDMGSTTPSTALAAMAASIALPPISKTRAPAAEASVWLVATIPNFVSTMERACQRPADASASSWAASGRWNMRGSTSGRYRRKRLSVVIGASAFPRLSAAEDVFWAHGMDAHFAIHKLRNVYVDGYAYESVGVVTAQ